MTWEETIEFIRTDPAYRFVVEKAYFESDLTLNIDRFKSSEEYLETLKLIRHYAPAATSILDVGSGNGISAVSFALDGYQVVACEPDPSNTIGSGAIKQLQAHYQLGSMEVVEAFAEDLDVAHRQFDVIYVRQAVHHAYDLNKFISNLARLLKPGGLLVTVRDHVIYNDQDKLNFLENHPLHKFYGGENAFTLHQYRNAFKLAGLHKKLELSHYDSVINYAPLSKKDFKSGNFLREELRRKIGALHNLPGALFLYKLKNGFYGKTFYDESKMPGRMYSFFHIKP